ncbi:hypothetical protein DFO45_0277 [Azorhizobium sp. AG788]|uniref:PIN domain-containing protein n=1 Tax=Azorhizobium sp. AG788 TaxID=2183897 RepID=UPI00105EE99C|nr:PIN domain-containing protein [Azorhizobium sp. AG788]TDU00775.1 hypothetical protein DFO45_0277 [Azorhizobium sp. AG788]
MTATRAAGYLLDTNVISAASPRQAPHHADLVAWLVANGDRLWLSSISVIEIVAGIAAAERKATTRQVPELKVWLSAIEAYYADRILTIDPAAAHEIGRLLEHATATGHNCDFEDIAIAGIARSRGLIVLTRNVRDFAPLGVDIHDPFAALPD